jgi:hypothetical protein
MRINESVNSKRMSFSSMFTIDVAGFYFLLYAVILCFLQPMMRRILTVSARFLRLVESELETRNGLYRTLPYTMVPVFLVLDGSRFCVSRTKNGKEKCEWKPVIYALFFGENENGGT